MTENQNEINWQEKFEEYLKKSNKNIKHDIDGNQNDIYEISLTQENNKKQIIKYTHNTENNTWTKLVDNSLLLPNEQVVNVVEVTDFNKEFLFVTHERQKELVKKIEEYRNAPAQEEVEIAQSINKLLNDGAIVPPEYALFNVMGGEKDPLLLSVTALHKNFTNNEIATHMQNLKNGTLKTFKSKADTNENKLEFKSNIMNMVGITIAGKDNEQSRHLKKLEKKFSNVDKDKLKNIMDYFPGVAAFIAVNPDNIFAQDFLCILGYGGEGFDLNEYSKALEKVKKVTKEFSEIIKGELNYSNIKKLAKLDIECLELFQNVNNKMHHKPKPKKLVEDIINASKLRAEEGELNVLLERDPSKYVNDPIKYVQREIQENTGFKKISDTKNSERKEFISNIVKQCIPEGGYLIAEDCNKIVNKINAYQAEKGTEPPAAAISFKKVGSYLLAPFSYLAAGLLDLVTGFTQGFTKKLTEKIKNIDNPDYDISEVSFDTHAINNLTKSLNKELKISNPEKQKKSTSPTQSLNITDKTTFLEKEELRKKSNKNVQQTK